MLAYFTHSVMLILLQFESISVFKADESLTFVMESAGLWYLWIYFTLVISYCLYNWHKLITLTISCFFCVVPNLIKQSYKNFESVYKISKIANLSIFSNVAFMITLISNSYAIPYNLAAKILRITVLYFIKDQYIIFALFIVSTKQII